MRREMWEVRRETEGMASVVKDVDGSPGSARDTTLNVPRYTWLRLLKLVNLVYKDISTGKIKWWAVKNTKHF
ncbi:hypothetical protein Pmgp_03549 [Pelotomaculum propionicicum]|uniref:Uncharacterized protein n=1 Tax=Pelotomaculum propionicicum TaxID=258475 RepID=A0A4Y7RJI7_9FIRM|nr:hypothetical protein Pmgp_03549 [Pelotomaculum propionicicum]